jgi:hypothetical protein
MGLLYGRAGRLTAKNGGIRPGQASEKWNDGAPSVETAWKYFADSIGKPTMKNPLPPGWAPRPGPLTYREGFRPEMPFSCSLYEVQDPFMTRERFKHTVRAALGRLSTLSVFL